MHTATLKLHVCGVDIEGYYASLNGRDWMEFSEMPSAAEYPLVYDAFTRDALTTSYRDLRVRGATFHKRLNVGVARAVVDYHVYTDYSESSRGKEWNVLRLECGHGTDRRRRGSTVPTHARCERCARKPASRAA
jgi:hypothetical protein